MGNMHHAVPCHAGQLYGPSGVVADVEGLYRC